MAKASLSALILCGALAGGLSCSFAARAGDEDVKVEKKASEPAAPEDVAIPEAVEAEEPALQNPPEVAAPDFFSEPSRAQGVKQRGRRDPYDPDKNVDYTELLNLVETGEPSDGVLPPAPGFRGYMPNMVAVGIGDRTPGLGAMVEYSWNRVGLGAFYSYRKLSQQDVIAQSQSFFGVYGLYRWLPWDFSPYILIGLEVGSATEDPFGGNLGIGIEARLYQGATLLVGYTYHSTAHKGFFGGAVGWSF